MTFLYFVSYVTRKWTDRMNNDKAEPHMTRSPRILKKVAIYEGRAGSMRGNQGCGTVSICFSFSSLLSISPAASAWSSMPR